MMKEIFEKIIERLNEIYIDYEYEENSGFIEMCIDAVNQVAEEYKHGHFGCNMNGQHERCKDCGLRGECSHYNAEWFGENDKFCEWEYDEFEKSWRTQCGVLFKLNESDCEITHYCPYCGKKIKGVE